MLYITWLLISKGGKFFIKTALFTSSANFCELTHSCSFTCSSRWNIMVTNSSDPWKAAAWVTLINSAKCLLWLFGAQFW